MEYPFRVFRETFIASLDTIPPAICNYIHTRGRKRDRERERVLERIASIVEKQVFFPFTELDKQQQRYLNGSSSQLLLPLYIFLLFARRKINLTRDITSYHLSFNLPTSPLLSPVQQQVDAKRRSARSTHFSPSVSSSNATTTTLVYVYYSRSFSFVS